MDCNGTKCHVMPEDGEVSHSADCNLWPYELACIEYQLTGYYIDAAGNRKELTEAQKAAHPRLLRQMHFKTAVLKK